MAIIHFLQCPLHCCSQAFGDIVKASLFSVYFLPDGTKILVDSAPSSVKHFQYLTIIMSCSIGPLGTEGARLNDLLVAKMQSQRTL